MIKYAISIFLLLVLFFASCKQKNSSEYLELELLDSVNYTIPVLQKWDYTKGIYVNYDQNKPTVYYISTDRKLISYNLYSGVEKSHFNVDSALVDQTIFISVRLGTLYLHTSDDCLYEIKDKMAPRLVYKPKKDSFMLASFYTTPFHVDNNNVYISYLLNNTINNLGIYSALSISINDGVVKQYIAPLPSKYNNQYIYFRGNTMHMNDDYAYMGLQYTDSVMLYAKDDSLSLVKNNIKIFSEYNFPQIKVKDPKDFIQLNDYIDKEWMNMTVNQYHNDKTQTYIVKRLPSEDVKKYQYTLGKVEDTTYKGSVILPSDFNKSIHFIINDTLYYQAKGVDICKKYLIKIK